MYCWKSNRSLSRIPFSRIPGGTPGWPTAPSRMASHRARRSDLVLGKDFAGAQEPLAPQVETHQLVLETFEPADDRRGPPAPRPSTSGPTPSPAITPIWIKTPSAARRTKDRTGSCRPIVTKSPVDRKRMTRTRIIIDDRATSQAPARSAFATSRFRVCGGLLLPRNRQAKNFVDNSMVGNILSCTEAGVAGLCLASCDASVRWIEHLGRSRTAGERNRSISPRRRSVIRESC